LTRLVSISQLVAEARRGGEAAVAAAVAHAAAEADATRALLEQMNGALAQASAELSHAQTNAAQQVSDLRHVLYE
jgi:hypothetical protein